MAMAAYIIGMQKIASIASPKKELSTDFLSSSRMPGNQKVTNRPVLCAVCVPDFTGVEDIFRLTVGRQKIGFSTEVPSVLRAESVLTEATFSNGRQRHRNHETSSLLSQQTCRDAEPFGIQRLAADGLASATIPVGCVALIAFLAMQVGVNPRPIASFVLLGRFVCSRPIALGIPPQPGEGVRESGRRIGRGE